MNKYIIPVCEISKSKVYNLVIMAPNLRACREKVIDKFAKYSDSDDWNEFCDDLNTQDILIGIITDIEIL